MKRILLSITTVLAGLTVACSSGPEALPEVISTDAGQVSGMPSETAGVRVFKGLPFAAPPVGDLRWRAPQPVAAWEGVREATEFSETCVQASGGSEDCLYLNIWTPAQTADANLPVMLWVYGGGYNTGAGSQAMYDGEALAAKGAVIVTINYRLGAFGFFSHPELTAESNGQAAANFGLMDTVQSLDWVKRNIANFGGDPNRVTLFGESAGAGLIASVMVSPQAEGLFHRAIGESSGFTTATIGRQGTLAEAEQDGLAFAERAGAASLADLRAKSAEEIIAAGRGPGPIVDGVWVPDQVAVLFAEGKQHDVPVLVGSNRDESFGGTVNGMAEWQAGTDERYGALAASFREAYPATNDIEAQDAKWTVGRDEMAWVMRNWARMEAATGTNSTYLYFFTHQPPATPNAKGPFAPTKHGTATHVSEINYVFNHLSGSQFTATDHAVADTMSSYWVNFAANGDPNGEGLPEWPRFRAGSEPNAMIFGDEAVAGTTPAEAKAEVFQAYYDSLYQHD